MSEQKCGTCKWWVSDKSKDPRNEYLSAHHGTCQWIISKKRGRVPRWVCWGFTNDDYGTDCPTYEARP